MFSIIEVLFFVLLLTIFCFSLYLYSYNTHLDSVPKLPCTWSWILGHTMLMFNNTDILKIASEAAIKYGGLIRILVPPKVTILITDNEIIGRFFKDSDVKGVDYRFFQPWLGTGLLTSNGSKWKFHRKLLCQCFNSLSLMKDFIKVFDRCADDQVKELEDKIGNRNLDVVPIMKKYTLNILCETSMGISLYSIQGDEYIQSTRDLARVIFNRLKLPHTRVQLLYSLTKDYQIQKRCLKVINSVFDAIFEKKLQMSDEELESNDKRAFLDILMQFYKSSELTREDIRDEVNTFMFAGNETTAMTLSFAMYSLAHHPDVQEKIIKEQIEIFGSLNSCLEVTYDHLQQMKYLESVILETLRLYPSLPSIGKKVVEKIDIGNGIILPKNFSVILFVYGIHHHPKYFRDPEKFIPERFETDKILPYTFFPFGISPRICLGKKFAMLEMKTTMAKFISKFKISPSYPDFKPQLVPELTLASRNGVRISLEKR